jgi:hypothetical protein
MQKGNKCDTYSPFFQVTQALAWVLKAALSTDA